MGHKYGRRFDRKEIEAVIISLSKLAGLQKIPSQHDFRRAFTKEALKTSDMVTVARLLGHSGTLLVWRYDHQNEGDLKEAHDKSSPVDKLKYRK